MYPLMVMTQCTLIGFLKRPLKELLSLEFRYYIQTSLNSHAFTGGPDNETFYSLLQGVTYRLVQGVVKNIIPAVASTNAVIAASCATEVFKIATSCCVPLNNYMVLNVVDGIYTYTYEAERYFFHKVPSLDKIEC